MAQAIDMTPLYYKDSNGKEYKIQRWGIQISGMKKFIEYTDQKDTNYRADGSYSIQNIYLYEDEDDTYIYFQRHQSKGIATVPSSFKYTSQNVWSKVTKDWSVYIDSNGKRHTLYKK